MILRGIGARHFTSGAGPRAGYCWLAGACVVLWWPGAFPGAVLACAAAAVVMLLLVPGRQLPAAAWLLAAGCCTELAVQRALEQRWPVADGGQRVLALVRIDSLPAPRGALRECDAQLQVEAGAGRGRTLRARIAWSAAWPGPEAGERWRLLLRLRPPRAALNPGSTDFERLLFAEGIAALGTVVDSRLNRRLAAARPGLLALRAHVAQRIRESVEDRDAAALLAALAVGATGEMGRDQWRVFGTTGTTHLVAISGLHVTLFAWLTAAIVRRAWRWLPPLQRQPRDDWAAAAGFAAAAAYALLAGFSVPTQRTLAMLGTWLLARRCARVIRPGDVFSLALLAVLWLDPFAPLTAGFWLSFGAIAVLLVAELSRPAASPVAPRPAASAGEQVPAARPSRLRTLPARLQLALRTQFQVTLALAPATIALFASVPLAGLAVNLLAIPFFSFILVPLVLGGLALLPLHGGAAAATWQLAEFARASAWPLLESCATQPWASWQVDAAPPALLAAALALPWLLWPAPATWRVAAVLACVPLAGGRAPAPPAGGFEATLLDAGDGVAVLVRTAGHALLYDTGEVRGSRGARIERSVLPALLAQEAPRLDLLVISDASGFRAAGAGRLLARAPVGAAVFGGGWPGTPDGLAPCRTERRWSWDGVRFLLLPVPAADRPADGGAAGCVLHVSAAGGAGSLLLAARLDAAGGRALLGRARPLRASVALAPRAGSPAALAPGFTATLRAGSVLVASRELDAPRRALLARAWAIEPAAVRSTAREGPLQVLATPGRGLRVRAWLAQQPGWRWRVPRND